MSTTYKKEIIKANQEHIIDSFDSVDNFIEQVKYDLKYNSSVYSCIAEMVQGGMFLCYYDTVRSYLMELLHETPEQANKYNDSQVWALYKHLIARDGEKLYYKTIKA